MKPIYTKQRLKGRRLCQWCDRKATLKFSVDQGKRKAHAWCCADHEDAARRKVGI